MSTKSKPGRPKTGSATRNKHGRWCVRFPLPTGRRKFITLPASYDKWSEKRVQDLAVHYAERAAADPTLQPDYVEPSAPGKPSTVAEVVELWLPLIEASPKLRKASKVALRLAGKRIVAQFGPRAMANITTGDLRGWLRDLGERFSASSTNNTFNSFGRLWDDAQAENWIDCPNLCRNRKVREELPRVMVDPDGIAHWTLDEARSLVSHDDVPAERRVLYVVGLLSGCRMGELAGLTWGHVRDEKGIECLRIERALALVSDQDDNIQDPKTGAGVRWIPLHRTAAAWLDWWRCEGWATYVGRAPKDADPVFPDAKGAPTRGNKKCRPPELLRADLQAARLPSHFEGVPFDTRAWRRSFQTWLEASDVHPNHCKRLMGHSRSDVTSQHYTAKDLGALVRAVETIALDVPTPSEVDSTAPDVEVSPIFSPTGTDATSLTTQETQHKQQLAPVAQWIEQRFPKPKVARSNRAGGAQESRRLAAQPGESRVGAWDYRSPSLRPTSWGSCSRRGDWSPWCYASP